MSREALRQHWRLKLGEFETSGLNASHFCREKSLNYAQFLFWRKKFDLPEASSKSTSVFEELSSSPRLALASGDLELEVDCCIDFNSLVQVIGALYRAAELRR